MAPLSAMTGKNTKFDWTKECQESFEETKRVMAQEMPLACPDFNSTFHAHADASDKQLGGVIMQENKPLAFHSRKLNKSQRNCTVREKRIVVHSRSTKRIQKCASWTEAGCTHGSQKCPAQTNAN